jgi:hypothetical protein
MPGLRNGSGEEIVMSSENFPLTHDSILNTKIW